MHLLKKLSSERLLHASLLIGRVRVLWTCYSDNNSLLQPLGFLFLFLFFETGFLCVALICPGTRSVEQDGLELTEILLPLSPKCWDEKPCATTTWLASFFFC